MKCMHPRRDAAALLDRVPVDRMRSTSGLLNSTLGVADYYLTSKRICADKEVPGTLQVNLYEVIVEGCNRQAQQLQGYSLHRHADAAELIYVAPNGNAFEMKYIVPKTFRKAITAKHILRIDKTLLVCGIQDLDSRSKVIPESCKTFFPLTVAS
eukprot:1822035-Amphidinium_carterae.1